MSGPGEAPAARLLQGRWGALRPLNPATDAAELFRLTHDAHVTVTWAEMKVGPFPDEAAFHAHMDEMVADRTRSFFTILDRPGHPVGWMCLMEHSRRTRRSRLDTSPTRRGIRLGARERSVLSHHGLRFRRAGSGRLEWTCTAENHRSRRAAERLAGFRPGDHAARYLSSRAGSGISPCSLLSEDWPTRKREFEAVADPDNFDESGRRRRPRLAGGGNGRAARLSLSFVTPGGYGRAVPAAELEGFAMAHGIDPAFPQFRGAGHTVEVRSKVHVRGRLPR